MKIELQVPMRPEDFKIRTMRGLAQLLREILGCSGQKAHQVAKKLWAKGVVIA